MTVRFGNYRLGFYIGVLLFSAIVLALGANFASLFFPKYHRDFTIFSLVVPSITLLSFLLTLQWASPQSEAFTLFFLGTLWLAMGAWSTDVIGFLQCDSLSGQKTPSRNGQTNLQTFCYEMKVIQAISWSLFAVFVIAFRILFQLVALAQQFGRFRIWIEPIRDLPWFGEMPGYYNTGTVATTGMVQYPVVSAAAPVGYGNPYGYPMTTPGRSAIIPGMNGPLNVNY